MMEEHSGDGGGGGLDCGFGLGCKGIVVDSVRVVDGVVAVVADDDGDGGYDLNLLTKGDDNYRTADFDNSGYDFCAGAVFVAGDDVSASGGGGCGNFGSDGKTGGGERTQGDSE